MDEDRRSEKEPTLGAHQIQSHTIEGLFAVDTFRIEGKNVKPGDTAIFGVLQTKILSIIGLPGEFKKNTKTPSRVVLTSKTSQKQVNFLILVVGYRREP